MAASNHLRTAVVIVNYRTPDLVRECLDSVVPQLDPTQDRVVVVDNASGDGSADSIEAAIRESAWQRSRANRAFEHQRRLLGGETTSAFRRFALATTFSSTATPSRSPAHWKALRDAAERAPRAAIVGPRLLDASGKPQVSCFRFPRPVSELLWSARTGTRLPVSPPLRGSATRRSLCPPRRSG